MSLTIGDLLEILLNTPVSMLLAGIGGVVLFQVLRIGYGALAQHFKLWPFNQRTAVDFRRDREAAERSATKK